MGRLRVNGTEPLLRQDLLSRAAPVARRIGVTAARRARRWRPDGASRAGRPRHAAVSGRGAWTLTPSHPCAGARVLRAPPKTQRPARPSRSPRVRGRPLGSYGLLKPALRAAEAARGREMQLAARCGPPASLASAGAPRVGVRCGRTSSAPQPFLLTPGRALRRPLAAATGSAERPRLPSKSGRCRRKLS